MSNLEEMKMITTDRTYTYNEFKQFMSDQLNGHSVYDETLTESIRLNVQRIKRIEKTIQPDHLITGWLRKNTSEMDWTILIEPWCGDGGQILPILNKLALASNDKIRIKMILRDMNPEIMDQFLTKDTRSIPIIICTERSSGKFMWKWGPRPSTINALADQYKAENPGHTHYDLVYQIHKWYAEDAGRSTMSELINMISQKSAAINS